MDTAVLAPLRAGAATAVTNPIAALTASKGAVVSSVLSLNPGSPSVGPNLEN